MKYKLFKITAFLIFAVFIIILLSVLCAPLIYSSRQTLTGILRNKEIYFALSLTLTTSLISVIIITLLGLPVGYVLARYNFLGKKIFDILIDIPITSPPLVTGLSLLILFGPILGSRLASLGLEFVFTPAGIIAAQIMVGVPFAIRGFKIAFSSVNPVLEKAAMTLGDHPFRVFRRITLPLAKNGIIAGITTAWARAVGEFGASVMLAGATKFKTETLPIAIYLNISTGNMDMAISIALIMILFSIIVLIIIKRFEKSQYDYDEGKGDDIICQS